jgi:ADP-ribose pyrophosphatase YjhB (NUDIX family)
LNDLKQALYLIADEMRGMASISRWFAGNVYEVERAHRIMELAVQVAALADESPSEEVRAIFEQEPWLRFSPVIGVEAAVFNDQGEILLIQRRDNAHWALPGGLAEIGSTFPESTLKELWEEAGLRGRVTRLLGVFDGRLWGSRFKAHLVHMVYQVVCDDLMPQPGIETLDARFFARESLPLPLHPGHDRRIPAVCAALDQDTFFDPADSTQMEMPMHQRHHEPGNGQAH